MYPPDVLRGLRSSLQVNTVFQYQCRIKVPICRLDHHRYSVLEKKIQPKKMYELNVCVNYHHLKNKTQEANTNLI